MLNSPKSNPNARIPTQIFGQVIEALELLNDGIDELKEVAPDAIATLKIVVLQMFESRES